MDQGNNYKKDKQSCMRHSVLTCLKILPSIIKIFLMVTETKIRENIDQGT